MWVLAAVIGLRSQARSYRTTVDATACRRVEHDVSDTASARGVLITLRSGFTLTS